MTLPENPTLAEVLSWSLTLGYCIGLAVLAIAGSYFVIGSHLEKRRAKAELRRAKERKFLPPQANATQRTLALLRERREEEQQRQWRHESAHRSDDGMGTLAAGMVIGAVALSGSADAGDCGDL